ncbi:response regulator transcription factor [Endozoicomonas sp. G2_1]|uniref:LytR/AlgR family response regulator transcription factor n=1 Tax=Endozoicomonas sp. G2_1 TaxID=2821091 RepID=UPI001ADC3B23|nr:LytTR family DNA-binding domain-containing protein [Endozoicomonas sp. G2_1]MBO9488907.1 response regulator transcription factor [Endozoicomonas sp. G2_1]
MSSSDKKLKSAMSVWQFFLFITIVYAVGLFITHRTTVFETIFWSGYQLQALNDQGTWVDSNRMKIGDNEKIQNIRFTIHIDDSEKWKQPISLMIGGPFSAEIFWDGENIGNKGSAGNTINEETIGPIDFSSFVPPRLLQPGIHLIELRLSTQHLLMSDSSILHYVWLTPYRKDGQRDLRYYVAPLLILSGLILLSIQSLRIGRSAGNIMHTGLGGYGLFIIVVLLAEVSRAIINYPYHYHELRSVVGWLGLMAAGLTLIYTCYKVIDAKFAKIPLVLGALISLINNYLPTNGEDLQLAKSFILLVLAPSLIFAVLSLKKRIGYLSTLPIFCIASVVSIESSIGLFLDSFLFIGSLILIGGAWGWSYVDTKNQAGAQNADDELQQFTIKDAGQEKVIRVSECYALKGEGNYTLVMLLDGSTYLHQNGLGAIMNTGPANFVRVHKSFAVNLNVVRTLKSAPGSKYWLEMTNQEKIPVSRYRVAELRGLLKRSK